MEKIRKIPTENEMLEHLRKGRVFLPPLSFRFLESGPTVNKNRRLDALVEASWKGKIAKFVVECKALWTPKAFEDGLNRLKSLPLPKGYQSLLFLPFLSENQLQELERQGISGIDLCGNGVIIAPDMFAVFRSGGKNRFSSSAPIKNIYRKNSSMVGRVFLLKPIFRAVQEVCADINRRNMLVKRWNKKPMSLSTVSKALSSLEQDLIVKRKDTIRLLQPDKLLEKLNVNYTFPNIKERVRLKISQQPKNILKLLSELSQRLNLPLLATGKSSVGRYAVMQRGEVFSVYCPSIAALRERLDGKQTERFPNLELLETEDETLYFDARWGDDFWWASPVQVYLELMAGDKRDRETAEQVKTLLLENIKQAKKKSLLQSVLII